MESISKLNTLKPDHSSRVKVKEWLLKLNQMKASDELDDDQIRQMTFDLDTAYADFVKWLESDN